MSGIYLGTYDPDKVVLLLDDIPVFGFSDGDDAISIERNEDFTNETVGMKGDISRAINRNATGILTIRLMHNSPYLQFIEQMARQEYTPEVKASLLDPSTPAGSFGTSIAWLKTDATHSWGPEVGEREYQFFLTSVRRGGGNNLDGVLAYAAARGLSS